MTVLLMIFMEIAHEEERKWKEIFRLQNSVNMMLTRCRRSIISTYRDLQNSYLVDFSDFNED